MNDQTTPADDVSVRLRAAWVRHVDDDTSLFDRLVTRHREKHRRYHGLAHLDHVVRDVETLGAAEDASATEVGTAVAAAMFHDAIYEPRSPSNERASARLARRDLATLGWEPARTDAVATMIEGTATHLAPGDRATALLFDADLAILGAERAAYESYRCAVREEYAHVDDDAWRVGRHDVLCAFLERPHIYATDTGRGRWADRAASNLTAEIESLRA